MVRLPPPARPLFPYLKPVYTLLTRAVAPVTVGLSRRRDGLVPTTVATTMDDAVAAGGGRVVTARPAETVTRSRPAGSPTPHPTYSQNTEDRLARVAVAELTNGRVMSPHSAVVTDGGALVQEVSAYFGTTRPREHPLYLHPFPDPPVHVDGRLGVLASRGDSNYYHFLIEVMPRIGVIEQCADIEPPERWYVAAGTSFQRELLTLAGIPEDRRIDSGAVPHVQADTLVVPGLPSMLELNPPWIVPFLRDRLMAQPFDRIPGRGIYVTRGYARHNRRVNNETEVMAALSDRGFSRIDPSRLSVSEQIRAFATASVIVTPHGAALANLVFASPGATVIELFPAGYAKADYWKLANGVDGLAYEYLLGAGRPVRSLGEFLVADIEVDIGLLSGMVDAVMGRRTAA
jgi:capsular polysaccharide biosynthesis protein